MAMWPTDAPTAVDPGWSWDDDFKFTQAVRLGPWLFISGQAGLESDGRLAGPDMATQARTTFANMEALLRAAGGSLRNVVQIRAYITDFADYAAYNQARREALGEATFASTTVRVAGLYFEGMRVEVDAVAYIPPGAG